MKRSSVQPPSPIQSPVHLSARRQSMRRVGRARSGFWVLLLLLMQTNIAYGGWTQPKGAYYVKAWLREIQGDSAFLSNGEIHPAAEHYRDRSLNLYGEYGLSDRLTLTGSLSPWGESQFIIDKTLAPSLREAEEESEQSYVGPLSFGARYQLLSEGPIRLSLFGAYRFAPPIGDEPMAEVESRGGEESACVGDPCVIFWQPTLSAHALEMGLALGYGLPAGFWSQLNGGFRHTISLDDRHEISPALFGGVQLGWSSGAIRSLWGLGLVVDYHLNLLEPLAEVEESVASGVAQTRYLGTGWSLGFWLTEWIGLSVAREGVLYAEANAATPSWFFALELK